MFPCTSALFEDDLGRMRIGLPDSLNLFLVRASVRDDETVARDIWFARLNLPVSKLARRITKERLPGMDPHRLRRAEIRGMAHNRQSGEDSVHVSADMTPVCASLVTFYAVGFAV